VGGRLATAPPPPTTGEGLVTEAADVLFHLYVLLAVAGVDIADVEGELESRRR
jgi:phosphoribosyl-ATP pyrophosphohydrolase